MEWFEQAAAQGHPEATRMLGYLHAEGRGVPPDEARAAELYGRAAELGDPFGQFNYAVMIDQSQGGLTRDLDAAIRWLQLAVKQGVNDGGQRLAELLSERNRPNED